MTNCSRLPVPRHLPEPCITTILKACYHGTTCSGSCIICTASRRMHHDVTWHQCGTCKTAWHWMWHIFKICHFFIWPAVHPIMLNVAYNVACRPLSLNDTSKASWRIFKQKHVVYSLRIYLYKLVKRRLTCGGYLFRTFKEAYFPNITKRSFLRLSFQQHI